MNKSEALRKTKKDIRGVLRAWGSVFKARGVLATIKTVSAHVIPRNCDSLSGPCIETGMGWCWEDAVRDLYVRVTRWRNG